MFFWNFSPCHPSLPPTRAINCCHPSPSPTTETPHCCHPPRWVVQLQMLVVCYISGGWLWWVVAVGVRGGGWVVSVGSDGCWWQLCCWVAIADVGLGCCLTVLVWPIPPKKVKKKVGLKWLKMDFKGMFFVWIFSSSWDTHPPKCG